MIRFILALALVFSLAGCAAKQRMGGGGDVVGNGLMPEGYSPQDSACDCSAPGQPAECDCRPALKKKPKKSHY